MESSRQWSGKKVWMVAWWTAFVVVRLYRISYGEPGYNTPVFYWLLEAGIFLSTFPASFVYTIVCAEIIHPSYYSIEMEPLFWMGMFAAGYIQWLYFLPPLFGKRKLITLGLTSAQTETSHERFSHSSPLPAKVPPIAARIEPPLLQTSDASPPALQTTRAHVLQTSDNSQHASRVLEAYAPPVPRFDEHGRSPIERAFADALSG